MTNSQTSKPIEITFYFDGKKYIALKGDTLAAALLRNGVFIVARSFKYHRPRGVLSAGVEEANAIVCIENEHCYQASVQATKIEVFEGLKARSLNSWPNAKYDVLSLVGALSPFFVSGFYYKTFKWPSWRFWSPIVRAMAGLGVVPKKADKNTYDKCYSHTDVLIVGGGPSGLMAAYAHAQSGAEVVLVEQNPNLGGSLLFEQVKINSKTALEWVKKTEKLLANMANVKIIKNATATGFYDHTLVTVSENLSCKKQKSDHKKLPNERFHHIRAKQVVMATGAIERPLVFTNNDRPRVMLASAVRQYLNQYGIAVGKRVLIATNNDTAYRTALDLHSAGVAVEGVVDARINPSGSMAKKALKAGITIFAGHVVSNIKGARGVKAVEVSPIDTKNNTLGKNSQTIICDTLAMSGGWSPVVHLHSQSGGKLRFDEKTQSFVPSEYVAQNICIGAANGSFNLSQCFKEAIGNFAVDCPEVEPQKQEKIIPLWDLPHSSKQEKKGKRWVDLLHDVTANDVALAARENYTSIEHFKRYTTTGMALDQGKTSNVNAIAILAKATSREIQQVGTTKFRPPFTSVTMGALAARSTADLFKPRKLLPCHNWHVANGALMEDYGGWQRPFCYKRQGEGEHEAVKREVLCVRSNVGILDYSPLGKIDVSGADAAKFLNRFYINNVESLKVGKSRYGLMLNEHGSIIDDGVFSRIANDHFMVTTTSGGAESVALMFEEWRQCEWPNLDVAINPITTGWGTISIQGPKARDVLLALECGVDLSKDKFPHMSIQLGEIAGVEVRILRTSFTGELGFEVSIPLSYTASLWQKLMEVGQRFGISAFGLEALMVMRTEKGFIHVGVETDSSSIPSDVGFGVVAGKKTTDFIGKRSLLRSDATRKDREALVGFQAVGDGKQLPLPMGGIVLAAGYETAPAPMEGRVTSSYFSPTLKTPIALGLIKGGVGRLGEQVKIYDADGVREAIIVEPCFYDKKGERINV